MFDTMIRFFQDGGAFMYPIVIIMALGIAIAIERYLYLTRARSVNQRAWEELHPVLSRGEYKRAGELSAQSDAAVSKILVYGLSRMENGHVTEGMEAAMEEGLMEVMPRLEKRTHYLATFANIATLLGLLGTVIGMIQAFTAVANANPAEKAALLSSSISVAMNTTAFGLIVAIPFMLIHAVLHTKTTELVDSLEMIAVKFNNLIRNQTRS